MKYYFLLLLPVIVLLSGCDGSDSPEKETGGKITLRFSHLVDGASLEKYVMKYTNAAGNNYQVDELKYFISDLTIYKSNGQVILLNGWKDIHYVDIDHASSLTWEVFDDIPKGNYDSLSFTFGISEQKNQSMMFVNPPESEMMWPDSLGGGYHYMMINGKWEDLNHQKRPFYCHLGIGKVTDCCGTRFIQNYFTVTLFTAGLSIMDKETKPIDIIMHIDRWFNSAFTYDHNEYGPDIMYNQEAMYKIRENGKKVFEVRLGDNIE